MRLTLPEIDFSKGFTPSNDIFNRVKLADKIEKIIRNIEEEHLVFGIDDNWGNGKTTFIKMWESKIKIEDSFNFIYFDAFENDYHDDPFLQISSMLYESIEDNKEDLKERFLKTATRVGKNVLSIGAKIGINIATAGVLNNTVLESSSDIIESSLNEHVDNYIKERIEKSEKEKQTITKFQDTLSEIAKDKKIIFVIDELDRAKPSYSLDLLERVKHIFSTKNVFFILSMNKPQFEKMITKRYGEIDASAYLNKFIHLWFSLPNVKNAINENLQVKTYLNHLRSKIIIPNVHNNYSIEPLIFLSNHHSLSLREIQRCFSQLLLMHMCLQESVTNEDYVALSLISYISVIDSNLMKRIRLNQVRREDMIQHLTNIDINKYSPSKEQPALLSIIKCINTELYSQEAYATKVEEKSNLIFVSNWGDQPKPLTYAVSLLDDLPISIPE